MKTSLVAKVYAWLMAAILLVSMAHLLTDAFGVWAFIPGFALGAIISMVVFTWLDMLERD